MVSSNHVLLQMAGAALKMITFDNTSSNHCTFNIFTQSKYLPQLVQHIEDSPKEIINKLEQIRDLCNYLDIDYISATCF
jgi:hypothetical protein